MHLKYTTVEAVNRRLNGRLTIGGNKTTMGGTVVSGDLAVQIIEQIEARIDGALRQYYELPLDNAHPQLAEIAELGAVCHLINQYQVGGKTNEAIWACTEFDKLMGELADVALSDETWLSAGASPAGQSQAGAFAGYAKDAAVTVDW